MRKRAILITGLVLFLVAAAGCTGDMASDEIASKAQEKYDSIESYRGTIIIEAPGLMATEGSDEVRRMEAEMAFKKPDMNRVEYVSEDKRGDITVTNGSTTWIYDASENSVRVIERVGEAPAETDIGPFVKNMMERFDVSLRGTGTVSGRDCYVLELTPKEEQKMVGNQTVWIDREHWMPIKIESELTVRNETVTNTVLYRDMEFNVEIPDSEFEFEVPENATVEESTITPPEKYSSFDEAQQNTDFELKEPTYLPEGYEFDDAFVMSEGRVVSLNYGRGTEGLVLTQRQAPKGAEGDIEVVGGPGDAESETVEVNGRNATLRKMGPSDDFRRLSWGCGDLIMSLSGELDKDELIKMAESVECG